MQFLRIIKEVARIRGELQNDSVSGLSSDELQKIKDDINHEVRKLCDIKPPFLHNQMHIKMQDSVPILSGTDNSLTGSKGVPFVTDSASNLTKKHINWMLSDGTHRYRVTNVVGTTVSLDYSTFTTATTATAWVAYKDVYPLPHNCGRLIDVWYEDGDRLMRDLPGTEFMQLYKEITTGSNSTVYSQDAFTNRWGDYKFNQTAVTFTNGSSTVNVGTTYAAYYDIGDVLKADTATTAEYLHTVIGKDASNIYLDRNYTGDTGLVTIEDNPKTHTSYLSFWMIPDTAKDVVVDCYERSQDMVSDTDECILLERFMKVVIIGAIREDAISRGFLTQQQVAWYEEEKGNMKLTPYAGLVTDKQTHAPLGGQYTFRNTDISS